ncbi:MAG: hypothetical protein UX87_C0051G0002 [Candidatus Amesbacteria bacterium GW2011_GWA1_47_16]|uniref:Uncharacterized protein n=1 Tax=Candidatus Amesbacteria bacterium GW2011_GWA1_47_16 TaxID=1618353 RepID=A0A0G1UX73_9BACT|nr:MAG: hypothetical protein UX87_C0051G0002 [Candidatus Amesbacteria bacterium GW2011_GWA1_47_16]
MGQVNFNLALESITGDVGGAVYPNGIGDIRLIGAVGIAIIGDPATNSLTISGAGLIHQINADVGAAIPAAGLIGMVGGTNIATAGAGNTVTINLDGTTDHAVQVGNAAGALTSLAVGLTGTILTGVTGADPVWTTTTYPATIAIGEILHGSALNVISGLAAGATGETLMGATGAAPGWTASPSFGGTATAATGFTATTGNITATLGDVVITAGNLTIPTTTAAVGQIIQAGNRLLHTFGTNNMFLGITAGNTTLTVANAVVNLGIGLQALSALTDGNWNVVVGHSSAQTLTTGIQNTVLGTAALQIATSAGGNVSIGLGSLAQLLTGTANIAVGNTSGNALVGAESNNILIGHTGVAVESNTIRLGTVGTQTATYLAGNTTSSGSFTSTAGAITASLGDFVATAGDVNIGNVAVAITPPYVNFKKSRTAAVITSGDLLGGITFQGHDSGTYKIGSQITSTSSGTIAAGRVASDLKFYTSPDAVSAAVLRTTIAPTGEVTIAIPDSGTALTVTGVAVTDTIAVPIGDVRVTLGHVYANEFNTITNPAISMALYENTVFAEGTDLNVDVVVVPKGVGGFVLDGLWGGVLLSQWRTEQRDASTADAVPTAIITIPLIAKQMVTITAYVNGFLSTGAEALGGNVMFSVARPAIGNVAVVGNVNITYAASGVSTAALDAGVDVGAQTLVVYVVGVAAETWEWVSTYSYMYTTLP